MKVKDVRTYQDGIYGYCRCGREVKKGKDEECPLCCVKLEWEEEENGNDFDKR